MNQLERPLNPALTAYAKDTLHQLDRIPDARREQLEALAHFVAERTRSGEPALLTFICTHNSRRSHIAQVCAQMAAHALGIEGVRTYSGGTEASAFNPRAVAALRRVGFQIDAPNGDDNPRYLVRFSDAGEPMECFSKVYDQSPNPSRNFCAVMTCSDADEACPIVFGAADRISLPYDDPKAADGTPQETTVYDERCRQIACEMLYTFSRVGES